jgi:hypothetical protein
MRVARVASGKRRSLHPDPVMNVRMIRSQLLQTSPQRLRCIDESTCAVACERLSFRRSFGCNYLQSIDPRLRRDVTLTTIRRVDCRVTEPGCDSIGFYVRLCAVPIHVKVQHLSYRPIDRIRRALLLAERRTGRQENKTSSEKRSVRHTECSTPDHPKDRPSRARHRRPREMCAKASPLPVQQSPRMRAGLWCLVGA